MECLPILQKFACFLCQCILDVKSFGRVRLFATPWTVAHQAPPSMEFSRQEYWSGLPFPSPGDLPDPEIKPRSPALQADALPSEPPGNPKRLFHFPFPFLPLVSYEAVAFFPSVLTSQIVHCLFPDFCQVTVHQQVVWCPFQMRV